MSFGHEMRSYLYSYEKTNVYKLDILGNNIIIII